MTTPLLENILNQSAALRAVAAHQFGTGRVQLERMAELLRSKRKIVLSGMGASHFACVPLQYLLSASGFDAVCVETAELLYFTATTLNKDTAVLLVSRSGESIEVTRMLDRLTAMEIPVVGVVNVADSSLGRRANQAVYLHSPADQLVAIQTYTATLAVMATMHAALTGELDQAQLELVETIQILEDLIPVWVDQRETWHAFLESNSPLYLVGRGRSLGTIQEGVLLMHETAKSPAVGMSIPQFRHGPVEVVDSDFRVLVIGTQPETSDLDAQFASDIESMGGQVRWIGPECKAKPLSRWPQRVAARFASIVEIVPLQIAAYTKAELRGIMPGDFRWATAVTNTEAGFTAQK